MDASKSMTIGNMPEILQQQICTEIAASSLVLLAGKDKGGISGFEFCGSGTFVKVGKQYGVLTAEHVVNSSLFEGADYLGLSLLEYEHAPKLSLDELKIFYTIKPDNRELGPDLALIMLPPGKTSLLREKKRFIDMVHTRELIRKRHMKLGDGVWAVCGAPEKLVSKNRISSESLLNIAEFNSLVMLSGPTDTYQSGDFDYIEIGIGKNEAKDLPSTFSGVSGGGLWQIPIIIEEDGTVRADQPILSGVAFWERGEGTLVTSIKCHSHASLYGNLLELFDDCCGSGSSRIELARYWKSR